MNVHLIVPPVFFFISLLFSMLGMGGAQLYVPILFWLGLDFKTEAIPLGLLLNLVNTLSAATTYVRKKLVEWELALPFGLAMVFTAPLGAWLNFNLPTEPVILCFALFTAAAAILMLSGWRPKRKATLSRGQQTALWIGAGGLLGTIVGLIGRGGGSFVVPLFVLAGLDPRTAAATSTVIVSASALSAFLSHLAFAARPDWLLWGETILAVLAGSQIGSRLMAERLRPRALKVVFGLVLLGVAALLIVKDILHLI